MNDDNKDNNCGCFHCNPRWRWGVPTQQPIIDGSIVGGWVAGLQKEQRATKRGKTMPMRRTSKEEEDDDNNEGGDCAPAAAAVAAAATTGHHHRPPPQAAIPAPPLLPLLKQWQQWR